MDAVAKRRPVARRIFRSRWERMLGECESPIESELLAALCDLAGDRGYRVAARPRTDHETLVIKPQAWVDVVRVDLLVRFPFFGAEFAIVVEADGHDWHERTKVQARRDRGRDRDLQALGFRVLRFTGSEIRADAKGCAGEILDAIMDWQTAEVERHAPKPWRK